MSTTDAPARPDLSHLDPDVRLRIEVAETQGATWRPPYGDRYWWILRNDDVERSGRFGYFSVCDRHSALNAKGHQHSGSGMNPLTDPAAWGALMEKELDGWMSWVGSDGVTRHRCRWRRNEHSVLYGPDADSLPWAANLAVLAKYGRDTSPYTEGA